MATNHVYDFTLTDTGLDEFFAHLDSLAFFTSELQRDMRLAEIKDHQGENWLSNSVIDFKIYHDVMFGRTTYRVVNYRNIGGPKMAAVMNFTPKKA